MREAALRERVSAIAWVPTVHPEVTRILWLDPDDETTPFPSVTEALHDPEGLLAVGGKLSQRRLLAAYRCGIFPWYNAGQPVLWWSPDPRTVLFPDRVRISRSLAKSLRRRGFKTTMDCEFEAVVAACAEPRRGQAATWITSEMQRAYLEFHRRGHAHSLEVRLGSELVGGLYGVAIGGIFFGESMFNRVSDASKIALVALCAQLQAWQFSLIDCQIRSEHLLRMGAEEIPRGAFMRLLEEGKRRPGRLEPWVFDEQQLGRFMTGATQCTL